MLAFKIILSPESPITKDWLIKSVVIYSNGKFSCLNISHLQYLLCVTQSRLSDYNKSKPFSTNNQASNQVCKFICFAKCIYKVVLVLSSSGNKAFLIGVRGRRSVAPLLIRWGLQVRFPLGERRELLVAGRGCVRYPSVGKKFSEQFTGMREVPWLPKTLLYEQVFCRPRYNLWLRKNM